MALYEFRIIIIIIIDFSVFKTAAESEVYKILFNSPKKQSDSDPIPTYLFYLPPALYKFRIIIIISSSNEKVEKK